MVKFKTFFDHLNQILQYQDKNYWSKLTEDDKKTFSIYMMNRYLSMNPKWISLISELQRYIETLNQREAYLLYINILPKSNKFLKYIKSDNIKKYSENDIKLVSDYYQCSKKEAQEYMNILTKGELIQIVKCYGTLK